MISKFTYIVAVHNEAETLRESVHRLRAELATRFPGSKIILVENGSRDRSWDLCQELVQESPDTHAMTIPHAGLGYALHAGVGKAVELMHGQNLADQWIVLTAADLPFGFTDVDQFLSWRKAGGTGRIALGSKAHPKSQIAYPFLRKVMSLFYGIARRLLLGMKTGDSQGTVIFRADLAAEVNPRIRSRDFFYTTELVYLVERKREEVRELPVTLIREIRKSTVKPVRDGMRMIKQLIWLRKAHLLDNVD